jgi:hypothetical protein
MVHINTTNKSFLKVYYLLKEKGIENCTFFLELLDPSLEFVDPHDEEHLTEDQKQRIIVECTLNPWYFIRECVMIPTSGLVRYELNLGNLAFTWATLQNLSVYIVLPRQCGKTFAAAVVILWITYFGGRNTESMLYAQGDQNLANNIGRIRRLRDCLPSFLNFHHISKDRDGIKLIQFNALGNKILRQAPKKSVAAADSVGRGFSTPVVWYDEFAVIPNIRTQYMASILAQATVAKAAEKNGLPHSIMITTTAAFLNNEEGKFAYEFYKECFEFDETLYTLSKKEIIKLMENNAKQMFLRIEYPYWELGKDDTYYKEQATLLKWERDPIDREILCKWKEVDVYHPLGQEMVGLLESNIHKPVKTVVVNDIYRVKFYVDPSQIDYRIPYIIGGDCANNIGEDYSALVIIDPRNYEVIATVRTNMYSTMFFAHLIISLMRNYFYKSILVLERNLNGATILDRIIEDDMTLMNRIYNSPSKPDILGITTVSKSRTLLYNQVLKTAVDDSYNLIHDKVIIEEIKGLIKTRSGRIDHPPGGHDDTLISYLFARWFLMFGENIERYINPLSIGIFSDIKGENEMANEKMKEDKQQEMLEAQRRERETVRRMFRSQGAAPFGGELPSLIEQHRAIQEGRFTGISGRPTSANDIVQNMANYDRFNPRRGSDTRDKTLYELEEEEGEENEELDENEQEAQINNQLYFKNPKDIRFHKRPVRNTVQLEREIVSDSDRSDLYNFMQQFKRR